jgi:hypothetical protein
VRSYRSWLLAVCLSGLAPVPGLGNDRFDPLLPLVPASANYVVLIDVQGLHRSPLGVRSNWARRHPAAYQAGTIPFHPLARGFLLAAHYEQDFRVKSWEIGLAPWSRNLTVQDLRRVRGIEEAVAGQSVILSPRNAYFFVLDNRTAGVQFPADRQELARFLRTAREPRTAAVPEFLRSAAADMDETTPLVVAVDMADTADVKLVRKALGESKLVTDKQADLDGLAGLLASVQGMRLRLKVTDTIQGEFRITFSEPVKGHERELREVLLSALKQMNDDLEGLQTWDMAVEDKAVRFTKELGEAQFLDLLVKIQPGASIAAGSDSAGALDTEARATAARSYFQTVTGIVADLRQRSRRITNHEGMAQRFASAADRIDRLPTFGVDQDLLEYGATVSSELRMLGESLSGVPIRLSALEARTEVQVHAVPGAGGFVPGRFFGRMWRPGFVYHPPAFFYQTNLAEIRGKQAQVVADDEKNRLAVWRQFDERTAQMRRTLSSRYNRDF